MTERVMSIDALQAYFEETFRTGQVRVRETGNVVTVEPANEKRADCTIGLRGMFKDPDGRAVEKFLERKHADAELDL